MKKTHSNLGKIMGLSFGKAVTLLLVMASASHGQQFVMDGEAGFVLADIKFVFGPDAKDSDICPDGMTLGPAEIWAMTPEGKRRKGESDKEYSERRREALRKGMSREEYAAHPKNPCLHPEANDPDPHFQVVKRSDIPLDGINLDGKVSDNDFPGKNGGKGIDNQWWRVAGCSRGHQTTGPENTFGEVTIKVGEWGAVFKVSGVDDIKNDDEVTVGIYDTRDPAQLSPTRELLEYATYAINQDPRFRATTRGKIKDGVLTTEPTNIRFRYVINNIRFERELKDAVLHANISDEGVLEGYLAGYSPVDNIYDYQYGFRSGTDGTGKLASLRARAGSAGGKARTMPHTCPGAWYALNELADGHPDPETGKYTSISTQYHIKAIPAFVVDTETKSVNEGLDKAGYSRDRNYQNR